MTRVLDVRVVVALEETSLKEEVEMTQKTDSGPRSMKYTIDEVLSGMLALN